MSQHPRKVAVAAIMKNEGPYIVEWVAWHRLLGFEVMVADNGGDDGQTRLLIQMEIAGLIRRFDFRAINVLPQHIAYYLMFGAARDAGFQLLAFLDADEFFEPIQSTRGPNSGADLLHRLFAETGSAAIGFNWMLLGSSNQSEFSSDPVTQRFVMAAHKDFHKNRHIKSVVDVEKCHALLQGGNLYGVVHPHGLNIGDANYSHDGATFRTSPQFGIVDHVRWQNARIRHYVVKSREECKRKLARGRGDGGIFEADYFAEHDRNDVEAPLDPEALSLLRDAMAVIESKLDTVKTCDVPPPAADQAQVRAMEQLFDFHLQRMRTQYEHHIRAARPQVAHAQPPVPYQAQVQFSYGQHLAASPPKKQ